MSDGNGWEQRVTGWLNRIPGNKDYNDLERRRDVDRDIRKEVTDNLEIAITQVDRVAKKTADARDFAAIQPIENAAGKLRFAREKVRSLPSGYSGLFAMNSVGRDQLEMLADYDRGLVGLLGTVMAMADNLASSSDSAALQINADSLSGEVDKFVDNLTSRQRLIESGPTDQRTTEQVLQPVPEQPASATFAALKPGVALAVGPENYLADALARTVGGSVRPLLLRLNRDPEIWLFGFAQEGKERFFLAKAGSASIAADNPVIFQFTGSGQLESAGSPLDLTKLEMTLRRPAGEERAQLDINWGDREQLLDATEIDPSTIRIFGEPGKGH